MIAVTSSTVRPVVAVVGPTASGKSGLAIAVARSVGGEVINADAFALYRGMDIGTATPTQAERRMVPHHQIDVLDIWEDASVAVYQSRARADIDAVLARGRVPVVVGGSGLYVRAALDVLDIPPTDPALRARLEAEARQHGTPALRTRLERLDPEAAAAIEGNNVRRIVRALEVIELTGRPFSATMPRREFRLPTVMIGLAPDRAVLDERIGRRAGHMWQAGFLAEVTRLRAQGLAETRTASRAVGYAQALAQLAGDMTEVEAIEATAAATRRLARRQLSWFRADPRIRWLRSSDPGTHLPDALGVLEGTTGLVPGGDAGAGSAAAT